MFSGIILQKILDYLHLKKTIYMLNKETILVQGNK